MLRSVVVLLIALPALGLADRLITIPTARKIPYKTVRYELRFEPGEFGRRENLLAAGIGPAWETEIRSAPDPTFRRPGTVDLAYNYVAALPGYTPGFSAGVQDASNLTSTGRRFYAVTTYRIPCDVINGDYPLDLTLGMFAAGRWSPFLGVLFPFSKEFHLLAEEDGHYIATGLEFAPVKNLNFRTVVRNNRTLLSAQWTLHL
jgi:hypothetical protein